MRLAPPFLLLALFAGCVTAPNEEPAAPGANGVPNVVVILVDALRADHLGAYGYEHRTSPFFDQLSRKNFLFAHAYATASWTRPAVASIFTGLYPVRHGVEARRDVLPPDLPTLAEGLKAMGLHTVMLSTNPHLAATWGMTRGFDEVALLLPDPEEMKRGNDAGRVLERFQRQLKRLTPPFFVYVHLIDPHWPYRAPAEDLEAVRATPNPRDPATQYDAAVHFADRSIGSMLLTLSSRGWLDDTIVVVTADHGEELYEHGHQGHGTTLYEEVVHIPLALSIPPRLLRARSAPTSGPSASPPTTCPVVAANVSQVDLLPTLLTLIGAPVPAGLDGEDLTPLLTCAGAASRPLFFSINKEEASLAAVLVERAKLIVNRATGHRQLFLLDRDPAESHPESNDEALATAASLVATIERVEAAAQPGLHLELASRDEVQDRHHLKVVLTTTGRFTTTTPVGLEPEDRLGTSADQRSLWLDAWLSSTWQATPRRVWAQDRDAVIFDVVPPDAGLELTAWLDNQPAPEETLHLPRRPGGQPSWTAAELLRQAAGGDRRRSGIYLYARSGRAELHAQGTPELDQALKALGYVQ